MYSIASWKASTWNEDQLHPNATKISKRLLKNKNSILIDEDAVLL